MVHLFREIEALKRRVVYLSTAVESSLRQAVRAVEARNVELAGQIIARDREIDVMEVEIEEECLKMFALYQPVANDLRFIVAILKINNDIERIGDLAANIAKNALYMSKLAQPEIHPHISFEETSLKCLDMLKTSLDALVNQDADLARRVCSADDEMDELVHRMLDVIKDEIKRHPADTDLFVSYLNVFRHLERIADLATNIAEDTIYLKDGQIVRHSQMLSQKREPGGD